MTVDMLAATFFWPEGTVLGSRHPDTVEAAPAEPFAEAEAVNMDVLGPDGFWASVMRNLWRPGAASTPATAP